MSCFRTITLGSGVGGEYCAAGTAGCGKGNGRVKGGFCGCDGATSCVPRRALPPQNDVSAANYSCLCGTRLPCAASSVTGKCCRQPEYGCPLPPKPIHIKFKCPTYCSPTPILMDPCCPPPIIPPTCPTPPAPGTCCGSQKCGCRGR